MLRLVTVATLALTIAVHASAEPAKSFKGEGDGEHFNYTAEMVGNDLRLSGRTVESHEPFVLLVAPDGRVRGTFGSTDVSFYVPKKVREQAIESTVGAGPSAPTAIVASR